MNGSMYPNADYDNVVLNGDWPGSGPWYGWGLPLADEDGDGVFTGSLTLDPNVSFEFVVAVTGAADGWSGWGVQFGLVNVMVLTLQLQQVKAVHQVT